MKLKIREISTYDLPEISRLDLPEEERKEVLGMGFKDVPVGLMLSASYEIETTKCFYDVDTKEIIGVFGCTRNGVPWMLASKSLKKYWRQFLRGSKEVVRGWLEEHGTLQNFVGEDNEVARRWLEWLGFEIDYKPVHMSQYSVENNIYYNSFGMKKEVDDV